MHFVFVFVNIDPTKNIDVEVEATLDGKDYCRTVSGKGTQEIVNRHAPNGIGLKKNES